MSFDKIIPELLPMADLGDMWSTDKIPTVAGVMSVLNRSQGTILTPNTNFNDMTLNGTWEFASGTYINQPPVTVDGTNLKAGFLTVTVDNSNPVQAIFQEYKVWQAGENTGKVYTRGWHGLIGSWGNWISSGTDEELTSRVDTIEETLSNVTGTGERIVIFNKYEISGTYYGNIYDVEDNTWIRQFVLPYTNWSAGGSLLYLPSGRIVGIAVATNVIFSNTTIISDDRGKTWKEGALIPTSIIGTSSKGVVTSSGRIVFMAASAGIFVSDDGGESWNNSPITVPGASTFYGMTITKTGRIIGVTSNYIFYSDNNGNTWTTLGAILPISYNSLSSLVVGLSGRIIIINATSPRTCAYSDDNGATWSTVNLATSSITLTVDMQGLSVTSTGRILGVKRGSKTVVYSDDEGITWSSITIDIPTSLDTNSPIISLSSGRLVMFPSTNSYIYYSDDDGITWSYVVIPITTVVPGITTVLVPPINSIMDRIIHVQDFKTSGTGGTFTSDAWRTRELNRIVINTILGASLTNNQVILPPGKYFIQGNAPAMGVADNQAIIKNITSNSVAVTGTISYANATGYHHTTQSLLNGIIEITVTSAFEVQHFCNTTHATYGFGLGVLSNSGTQGGVYTNLVIRRIA